MRSADELRKIFLDFFAKRDHVIVPSSSLLPDDPSVLFTTAGMQQFKPYYTGEADPMTSAHPTLDGRPLGSKNAASIQKCLRTSDIDEVGDEKHLTFFEMLGNFSFGGYFKEEAIALAHEFLTKELGLTIEYVSVFGGEGEIPRDEESARIWKKLGFSERNGNLRFLGREENFWGPTGTHGPCGPTTEIYMNPSASSGQTIEIWNLVFNEYYQEQGGKLVSIESKGGVKGVDTGMGLERLLTALEKKRSVFETGLFLPLINSLAASSLKTRSSSGATSFEELWSPGAGVMQNIEKTAESARHVLNLRILADHLKASAFLIAEGIRPSNVERGYVLRRLIRRIMRYARVEELKNDFLVNSLDALAKIYQDSYLQISKKYREIQEVFEEEEEKFGKALGRGLKEFEKLSQSPEVQKEKIILGERAFWLYETYGLPIELIQELAAEQGLSVDHEGFGHAFEEHKEKSRAGLERKFGGHGLLLDTGELKAANEEELKKVTRLHTATHMLQAALRLVLGPDVTQTGSDITAERLRFDFTFPRKVTPEETQEVQDLVNQKVSEDLAVSMAVMPFEQAKAQGALTVAKAAYPAEVKVYSINGFSKEVCGGPHVERTSNVGRFRILKEESSSAGIRRIRASVE